MADHLSVASITLRQPNSDSPPSVNKEQGQLATSSHVKPHLGLFLWTDRTRSGQEYKEANKWGESFKK